MDVAMTELGANADENAVFTKAIGLTETYFKTNLYVSVHSIVT